MRLAAAELGDEREDRCCVLGLAGKTPEDHAGVFFQGAGEAGAREELRWVAVIYGGGLGDDLLKGDGELVRAKRAAFAHFLAERYDFIPRSRAILYLSLIGYLRGGSISAPQRLQARYPVVEPRAFSANCSQAYFDC